MTITNRKLEKIWEQVCSTAVPDFDIPIYEDMPLPMIMVQGWFYDQCKCFELLRKELTIEEQDQLFTSKSHLESVEAKCKKLWGLFKKNAVRGWGPHRHLLIMKYEYFCYWADQVFSKVAEVGTPKAMLEQLGTVEKAHNSFKQFYTTKTVNVLNAADTARLLARYDYLQPEERPLLARGALRGAAILLRDEPQWKSVDDLEKEYGDELKRVALEEEAASYIDKTEELAWFGKWKMEKGESLFCEVHKRLRAGTRPEGFA